MDQNSTGRSCQVVLSPVQSLRSNWLKKRLRLLSSFWLFGGFAVYRTAIYLRNLNALKLLCFYCHYSSDLSYEVIINHSFSK